MNFNPLINQRLCFSGFQLVALIVGIFFLLGLSLPKSFSLLGLIFVVGLVWGRRELKALIRARLVVSSMVLLVAFGCSFSIRQFQLGFWSWTGGSIADLLTFTLYPSLALAVGWLSRRTFLSRRAMSLAIVAFAVGGLCYVILSLAISRDPWWRLDEVFPSAVTVPWGDHGMSGQNVRSVEQRAMPALVLAGSLPLLLVRKSHGWLVKALLAFLVSLIAIYALWSLHGLLGYVALSVVVAPSFFLMLHRHWRVPLLSSAAVILGICLNRQWLCDERLPMQLAFLRHLADAPWGGRRISFSFEGCPSQGVMKFGPPPNFFHLPHNIFLDVINDVGILPAFFFILACSLLLCGLTQTFVLFYNAELWNISDAMAFGFVAVVVIQAMFQPFLYSDRSMFVASFLLTGALLAEFNGRQLVGVNHC